MTLTRTASDLQRNIGSVYELCHTTREPVYITRNGSADLVVMDARAFEERDTLAQAAYEREKRLHASIMRGWQQAQAGEMKPLAHVREERDGQPHG